MNLGILPAGVLATMASDDIDPEAIVAEISTIVKSRRYAIFRLTRNNHIRVDLVESALNSEINSFFSEILGDEASCFSARTCGATAPFSWSPLDDPSSRSHSRYLSDDVRAEIANSRFYVFFRRCTSAEKLLFIAQSSQDVEVLDTETLFCCHGLTQVVFDQVTVRGRTRGDATIRITAREAECLRWCAEGKTSEEIGIILSLSTHTVNHYLISATKKLNAVNRMHAITIAIRHGILDINREP